MCHVKRTKTGTVLSDGGKRAHSFRMKQAFAHKQSISSGLIGAHGRIKIAT